MTNIAVWDARLHGLAQVDREADILIQLNHAGADTAQIHYETDRIESFLIAGFARHFVRTLEQFAEVHRKLEEIDFLTNEERTELTVGFNSTTVTRPSETVVSLFEAQVERAPDATALIYSEQLFSYR